MATSIADRTDSERLTDEWRSQSTNGENISETERWVSFAAGGLLALYGARRRGWQGFSLATLGGALIARGASRYCAVYDTLGVDTAHGRVEPAKVLGRILPARTIEVERAVTIARPRAELFQFWRDLTNLPGVMEHLESVTVAEDGRSHWVASAPAGQSVEWDAQITEEIADELIAWRSLHDAEIENAGSIRFSDAPGGRGTIVHVSLRYRAPGGKLGSAVAKMFGEDPEQQVREDLRHFKQVMEAGEVPTIDGQPTGKVKEKNR